MKARKDIQELFTNYLTMTGSRNPDAAGDLLLAHCMLELRDAVTGALVVPASEGKPVNVAQILDDLRGQNVQL